VEDSPLTFPCDYPLKVMGAHTEEFRLRMRETVRSTLGADQPLSVSERTSSNNRFLSLTLTVRVDSRDQLDGLYRSLHATGLVLMAL
jgi:uncharacterized protein